MREQEQKPVEDLDVPEGESEALMGAEAAGKWYHAASAPDAPEASTYNIQPAWPAKWR
jgi:hypothetical protein